MSLRLTVLSSTAAGPERVWRELTDWAGQRRWIPFTTVEVRGGRATGVGVRAEALSGFRFLGLPIGLLDRFVVTGWRPPAADRAAELEVLHLGPYFTGTGVFGMRWVGARTELTATELVDLPGGAPVTALARLALPFLRQAMAYSLRRLALVCEQPAGEVLGGAV